jgi:alkylation response protein AidB-like acyl-CoA dehydrogenase
LGFKAKEKHVPDFAPPTADQVFALRINAGIEDLTDPDIAQAVAEGVGQFAQGVWAPLNRVGDTEGARLENGVVRLPEGYAEAYQAFVEAGWGAVAAPEAHGGQALPYALACCVLETLGAANFGFALLPMLTVGAIDAIDHHGSADQKALYLPRLVTGEWSGTMNLTEPQAGSDVGALRTTATPIEDGEHAGKYRIKGTKIFITFGDHELAGNIVHLVLARVPGAPTGSRGISLFIVPKYLPDPDGKPGRRNDVKVVSLEHKMGIHVSPTCVMSYGDNDDCIGEIVGAENEGLRAMFTMMNSARINVGSQGVQVAEAAWQRARAYARERVQSARAGSPDKTPVAIVEHPDVRRMLLRMRALTEGARALLYYTAGQVDRGAGGDPVAKARADLLVPLIKAWGTDVGVEVASLGVQIHGGMGFIEETGAAQHHRDARIAPIYEGTNGIQAADLVTRKLGMQDGGVLTALMAEIAHEARHVGPLAELAQACANVGEWMQHGASLDDKLAGSVPFLTMCAVAVAGWQLLRQGRAPHAPPGKPVVARWFLARIVPEALGLEASATGGAALLYELDAELLTS